MNNFFNTISALLIVAVTSVALVGCGKSCEKTDKAGEEKCDPTATENSGRYCDSGTPTAQPIGAQNTPTLPMTPAQNSAISPADAKLAAVSINRGSEYLLTTFEPKVGWGLAGRGGKKMFIPAATSLALWALVQHPGISMDTPQVKEGYDILLGYQKPDGGFYTSEGRPNYTTSLAVCALAAAKTDRFKPAIAKAVKFLRGLQITEGSVNPDPAKKGEIIASKHPYLGGVSYGPKHGRPDLNNVGHWVEAMHSAGVSADDPAMQNAVAFITRCQNRSESNDLAWAKTGPNDGSMVYAPAQRDTVKVESKADPDTAGMDAPIGYGSISYVGFKSLLYAGLTEKDPRVRALTAWLGEHWTLDRNPGMPPKRKEQSLYYYYLAMARALQAYGKPTLKHDGEKINWRDALTQAITQRQRKNGTWSNPADRWMEGDPTLVTAYEILALQAVLGK